MIIFKTGKLFAQHSVIIDDFFFHDKRLKCFFYDAIWQGNVVQGRDVVALSVGQQL